MMLQKKNVFLTLLALATICGWQTIALAAQEAKSAPAIQPAGLAAGSDTAAVDTRTMPVKDTQTAPVPERKPEAASPFKFWRKVNLLGGHLTAKMPAEAVVAPQPLQKTAGSQPVERETRVTIEQGKIRYSVLAYELFRSADNNFDSAAREYLKAYEKAMGPLAIAEPARIDGTNVRAILFKPTEREVTGEDLLLFGLLTVHPDHTVQEVNFYVSPSGASEFDKAYEFAAQIANTIDTGTRSFNLAGGPEFVGASNDAALMIRLPKNSIMTSQSGPDFIVHDIHLIAPLNDFYGTTGIYLGKEPQRMFDASTMDTASVAREQDKLVNQTVEWVQWSVREDTATAPVYDEETILPHPRNPDIKIHVFTTASSPEYRAQLRKIVQTLQLP